jgi:Flagellar capping protein
MSSYASGGIRVPGLSGNDTDFVGMIKKLKDIESRHVSQLARWKQDWQTRLNAFKELRGEIMTLQTTLNSMNSFGTFLAKATASSNEKAITAVADADAVNTSYNVVVNKLASNCTWTKNLSLYSKTDVIAEDAGHIEYTYKGKTRNINVPKGTTVEGLVKLINNDSKNPGARAQLIQGADGLTFQLRGMDTGKSNSLVIKSTANLTGLDVQLNPGKYTEESNRFTLNDVFANTTDVINNTGESKTFVYTVDGTRRVLDVPDGSTIDDLKTLVNNQMGGAADLATLDWDSGKGGYVFSIGKENTTYQMVKADGDTSSHFDDLMNRVWTSDTEKVLGSGDSPYTLEFQVEDSLGGKSATKSIEITEEMTMRDLMNAIRASVGSSCKVTPEDLGSGTFKLKVEIADTEHRVTVEDGTLDSMSYVPQKDASWDIRDAENAQVRINNYPSEESGKWLEVASNTLKSGEVMPGITFSLHSKGEADISVSTDTEKIAENIQAFVDAVNSFRTKLIELTAFDETKEVLDPDYAESQFEMQKGSVLQGNYGVQMIATRLKNAVAGTAMGFSPRMLDADGSVFSGDIFTTLSQIGIKTNATQGETNYGLLEINLVDGQGGSKSLSQALNEDPEAVAKLFAQNSEGASTSDYLHYSSHVSGITQPGNYSVSYKVNASGEITDAYINGQAAQIDLENNTLTAVGDSGAKGLVVQVVDLTPGLEITNETVSIKSGKIQEVLGLLSGTEGILGTNGTLRNLERNYQGIIDNIDKKIQREDSRIQRWETTMVLKFARLEQVLTNYGGIQATLESQLAQFSNK